MKKVLNEVLNQLEKESIDRFDIYTRLLLVNDTEQLFELEAEKSAFFTEYDFELGTSKFTIGDFYFNELTTKDELSEILLYWNKRRLDSNNPLMKFTYSILLWELKAHLHDKTIIPDVVKDITDTSLLIASSVGRDYPMYEVMFHLNYALIVASQANLLELSHKLKDCVMSFCGRMDLLDNQGIWYPVYQYLLINKKHIGLTDQETDLILAFINEMLNKEKYPPEIIRIGELLCNYYRKSQDVGSIRMVLDKVFNRLQEYGSSGIGMAVLYLGFLQVVNNYGYPDLSLKITQKMESNGKRILSEMHTRSMELPQDLQDQMENWKKDTKQRITDLLAKYDFDEVLSSLVVSQIPLKEAIVTDRETNATIFERIPSVVAQINVNSEGLPVTSNTELEDEESLLIKWLVERMFPTESFFFRFWFCELFAQCDESQDRISKLVSSSDNLKDRHKVIINKGIHFYFDKDYTAAIHLFIPQIEDVVRTIIEARGGIILKPNKYGGYDKKNLDELLRSDEIRTILDDSFLLYLKAILSHRHGYNLRNEVCHGLMDNFIDIISLRLLHIVCYLSMIE